MDRAIGTTMASGSIVHDRQMRIIDMLRERGSARVEELSEALAVSQVTVRRDLDYLCRKGLLVRRHGGAAPVLPQTDILPERRLVDKGVINIAEKKRIAERAVQLISDEDILFMNSGSTVLFFLHALRHKKIRVITNNAAAIGAERDPAIELMILGGEYRDQSQSLVGEFALNTMRDIYSSNTILGTNGLSLDKGLTTSVYQECSINQAMIQNTHGKVIVLADYSKMGKVSNFVSSPLSSVQVVVTDDKCPEEFRKGLQDLGIEVLIA
ncbi:MAG TPA: DeoR/GlpR family DNA-binding transcription regulator [Rectinemataceae bacterium]|nr:DeoR/GlpR family DNA-binding transcription regulator [Rectinemataceae bacterium]